MGIFLFIFSENSKILDEDTEWIIFNFLFFYQDEVGEC